jgi:diguanylate cyclase (GGDEF)-like protein/PAS domain S-box-containing protein
LARTPTTANAAKLESQKAEALTSTEFFMTKPRRWQKLQAQNLLLDAALSYMSQGLCMFDAAGRLVFWNKRFEEIYALQGRLHIGFTLRDILQQRLEVGTISEDPDEYARRAVAAAEAGQPFRHIFELSDGRSIAVANEARPTGGWVSTHDDITEQRQAAKALAAARAEAERAEQEARTAHARLLDAFEVVPEGLVLFDAEDRYVLWNRRYAELISERPTPLVVGLRYEDQLRAKVAHGQYPEAQGREEEWLSEQLAQHAAPQSSHEVRVAGDRWVRIEERRTADGGSVGVRIDITELKRREASFRMLFDSHPLPMWVWDRETFRYLAVNDAAITHYGYSREQFMAMSVLDIRPAEDRELIRQVAREPSGSRRTNRIMRHFKADGTLIKVSVQGHTLPYAGRIGVLAVAIDITERMRAEDELRRTKSFLDTVLDHVPAAITVKDAINNRYLLTNKKGEDLFGLGRDQISGRTADELFGPEAGQAIAALDRKALENDGLEYTGRPLHASSSDYEIVSTKWLVIRDTEGNPEHLLSIIEDITDRMRAADRSAYMARHDALTGLGNRLLFAERTNEALEGLSRSAAAFSILLLDLDQFKHVNDSLGHPIGDTLLKSVAQRLWEAVGAGDLVVRFGGDEFAILQQVTSHQRESAATLANYVRDRLVAPYDLAGHRVTIGTSIGMVLVPEHGTQFDQLMKYADLALYRAKSAGRNQFCFFESALEEKANARLTLENDLRGALRQGQFELHYQPVVDLSTREPQGAEALLRWNHPTMGMIAPDQFIPVAEDIGLINEVGEWVLCTACADAAGWAPRTKLAVNLSSVQFGHHDLVTAVYNTLSHSGLPPERLELEITESVLLQKSDDNIALLHQLKRIGVSIVLDDFGTGYSSLSYLKMFPWDKIKIDRSFVSEVATRADCRAIVCAIIGLGHSLHIATTAEGIETEEQCAQLRTDGCTIGQGYLFGRPVPKARLVLAAKHGPGQKTLQEHHGAPNQF